MRPMTLNVLAPVDRSKPRANIVGISLALEYLSKRALFSGGRISSCKIFEVFVKSPFNLPISSATASPVYYRMLSGNLIFKSLYIWLTVCHE